MAFNHCAAAVLQGFIHFLTKRPKESPLMPWAHLKATRQPRQQGLVELVEKSDWFACWLPLCSLSSTRFRAGRDLIPQILSARPKHPRSTSISRASNFRPRRTATPVARNLVLRADHLQDLSQQGGIVTNMHRQNQNHIEAKLPLPISIYIYRSAGRSSKRWLYNII